MRRLAPVLVAASLILSACGSSDDGAGAIDAGSREAALASLELTTEAASLEAKMAKLVAKLADKPSAKEREKLRQQLLRLQQRASELVASADTDSTFEADFEPLNGSGASGSATLVEAEGEVAIEGEVKGIEAGKAYPLSIHAFKPNRGASVCPPADAAKGSDDSLDSSEAADFYGPAAVELASIEGEKGETELASTAEAADAPPLTARALVLSDSNSEPLACAIPASDVPAAEETSTAQAIAGTEEAAGAALDAVVVIDSPTSKPAKIAESNGTEKVDSAAEHLEDAVELATSELEAEGELSTEDSEAIETAETEVATANEAIAASYSELEGFIEAEVQAKREREKQREAAAAAEGAAEPEDEPETSATEPGVCPDGMSSSAGSGGVFCFDDEGNSCRPYPPDQVVPQATPGLPNAAEIVGTPCSEVAG